jgi:hypothetical protein
MGTSGAISEINKLPEKGEKKHQLSIAAEKLYDDYLSDAGLTALSILDRKDFVLSIKTK